MLRVGLTGGIGAGKSTVADRLAELGAVVIDSDVLAREAVGLGTPALAEVVAAFGARVLGPDGALDRPSLAEVVFADPGARKRLNSIIHPRVRARSAELVAGAAPDAVVVHDIPLLVEGGLAPAFHLVLVVDAPEEERVRRLAAGRGMGQAQARARIRAQADDAARRAAADVWLDNAGSRAAVLAQVDRLWEERLLPFEANVRLRQAADPGPQPVVQYDPAWAAHGARLVARIALACGPLAIAVEHIGPTAVPGMPAEDRIDIQVGTGDPVGTDGIVDSAAELRAALADAGFPLVPADLAGADPVHLAADPGRSAAVRPMPVSSGAWRDGLLVRDWLRADERAREAYWHSAGGLEPSLAVTGARRWAAARGTDR